jgi:hypothetical protein
MHAFEDGKGSAQVTLAAVRFGREATATIRGRDGDDQTNQAHADSAAYT